MVRKATPVTCRGVRKDGRPCQGRSLDSGYCWGHDPGVAEKRADARRKGGYGKATAARLGKLVPPRLMGLYDILEEALGQVHRGELAPRIAVAMSSLAGAMVKVLSTGEMEDRLRRLEERIDAQQKGTVA